MIIQMDEYRVTGQDYVDNSLDYRHICGNAVLAPKFAARPGASPELPDDFDDFNAKDFIDRAYALATQI